MNNRTLKTLEFDKIINMLTDCACSQPAKDICKKLTPVSDISEIHTMLSETSDALTHILTQGIITFSTLKDVTSLCERLRLGSTLSSSELLAISSLLSCAGATKAYFRNNANDDDSTGDSLNDYYHALEPISNLMNEINRCILAEDEIADDASTELNNIRRRQKAANSRIHEQLASLLNSASNMLQDNIITLRNGRYCLPVKAEYRSTFKGMLHDQSATGATLFIEPASVVKLNNDIKMLETEEKAEIERILEILSNMCADNIPAIKTDFYTLRTLDFIFAKASLSKKMHGTKPVYTETSHINIKKGRHPLLDKKRCVPIDIQLGDDFSMLIVTGPNTGGKTVSLKTVGLLCLMGQSGLHIPAFDGSSLKLYKEIYADIGDEQSIEQNLSTFSSHMVNTVSILKSVDTQSLVLFDELGAGTDPVEGAALAMAILSYLHQQNINVMATTHYSELKMYALSTAGVENACCEFDVNTLSPTYRLLIGIPGKSNAFAISLKLGLSNDIIDMAKQNVAEDEKNFEDIISDLEKTRNDLETEKNELSQLRKEAANLKTQLKQQNQKLEASKEKILQNANRQAADILSEAKELADDSIRKFSKWAKENPDIQDMEERRRMLGEKIKKNSSVSSAPVTKKNTHKPSISDIQIGALVHVISMGTDGTVTTLPNSNGDFFVHVGLLKTKVNIKDTELLATKKEKKAEDKKQNGSGKIRIQKSASVHSEINLIGKTTDMAIPELDKYLDDAYLAHLTQVTVIHGRGTGALRNAVHSHLKGLKYVKSFRLGEFGEGDMGVTIVTFK